MAAVRRSKVALPTSIVKSISETAAVQNLATLTGKMVMATSVSLSPRKVKLLTV